MNPDEQLALKEDDDSFYASHLDKKQRNVVIIFVAIFHHKAFNLLIFEYEYMYGRSVVPNFVLYSEYLLISLVTNILFKTTCWCGRFDLPRFNRKCYDSSVFGRTKIPHQL